MHVAVESSNGVAQCPAVARWTRKCARASVALTKTLSLRVVFRRVSGLYASVHYDDALIGFFFGILLAHDLEEIARPCLASINVLWNAGHGAFFNALLPFDVDHTSGTLLILDAVEVPT